jgi:hypothetical protein
VSIHEREVVFVARGEERSWSPYINLQEFEGMLIGSHRRQKGKFMAFAHGAGQTGIRRGGSVGAVNS